MIGIRAGVASTPAEPPALEGNPTMDINSSFVTTVSTVAAAAAGYATRLRWLSRLAHIRWFTRRARRIGRKIHRIVVFAAAVAVTAFAVHLIVGPVDTHTSVLCSAAAGVVLAVLIRLKLVRL
jgi:hypothetical protein